VLTSAEL